MRSLLILIVMVPSVLFAGEANDNLKECKKIKNHLNEIQSHQHAFGRCSSKTKDAIIQVDSASYAIKQQKARTAIHYLSEAYRDLIDIVDLPCKKKDKILSTKNRIRILANKL